MWKNFHWLGTREATYTYDGYDVCCNMFHMTNMFVLFGSYDFATAVAKSTKLSDWSRSPPGLSSSAKAERACRRRFSNSLDCSQLLISKVFWGEHDGTWGNFSKIQILFLLWCNFAPMIVPKVLLSSSLIWVDFVSCCPWCLVMSCSRAPNLTNEMTVTTASKRRRNFRASE